MTKNSAKFIEILRINGYLPVPYSGRGMTGRKCVGLISPSALVDAWNIALELGTESTYASLIPRSDSMGRNEILYWPSVEWPNDED